MTTILDPGNQAESYNATVRAWRTSAGLWRADKLTGDTTLATRTSERDTARNSLYVSGVYLSGQTWQTKDGTDVATIATRDATIAADAVALAAVFPARASYATVTLPNGASGVGVLSGGSDPATMRSGNTWVVPAGTYMISAWAQRDGTVNASTGQINIRVNSGVVASSATGAWSPSEYKSVSYTAALGAATTIDITGMNAGGYGGVSGVGIVVVTRLS